MRVVQTKNLPAQCEDKQNKQRLVKPNKILLAVKTLEINTTSSN